LVQRKISLCEYTYCKRNPVQSFLKELRPLDLAFSLKNTLSLQLLLNTLDDFDETWYKERSHCVDVHIVREALSNYFPRVTVPRLNLFSEKYCFRNSS
jgi:hypothetical protein